LFIFYHLSFFLSLVVPFSSFSPHFFCLGLPLSYIYKTITMNHVTVCNCQWRIHFLWWLSFFLPGRTSDSYKHKSNGFKHQNISNFIKRKRRSETLLVVADDREVEMRKRSYCFAQTKLDLANQLRQLISKSIIIYKEVLRIFHHVILIYHFHYLCYIINWEYKSVIIGVFLYLNVFEYI